MLNGRDNMEKTVFETLSQVDVSKVTEDLQGKKYISWSDAWYMVKKVYPNATYETHEDEIGNPFFVSPMGIFVKVSTTIDGETQKIVYPVLNSANKALKAEAYTYKVKEFVWDNTKKKNIPTGKMIDKYVEPANSFDINTAIMRALAKCLALHGLAINIYRKEDFADPVTVDSAQLQEVLDLIKEKGLALSSVTKAWQIEKIANLHACNFDTMIDWIKKQR